MNWGRLPITVRTLMFRRGISQIAGMSPSFPPERDLHCVPMRRIFTPAVAGIHAARHLVWYLNYQISPSRYGDAR
jgi:hypothetical protein